jgi:hypothetical protein
MGRALRAVYDLRPAAVHSGVVEQSETNLETIRGGTALCGRLIRRTIETGCNINWNALVLSA